MMARRDDHRVVLGKFLLEQKVNSLFMSLIIQILIKVIISL
jgi:hypothetical protein